jgi:type IV pilus assembly protein PilO
MAIADQLNAQQMLEKMERLPKPWRFGMLGLVFLAVLVLYWVTLYGEKRQELSAVERRLTTLEAKINESRAVASNLEKFKEKREELQIELKQALRRLPNSQEFPVLLTDINSLGKKSGLEFRSFKPGKETARGFYAEVPIKIEIVGAYHDVGLFFDRLAGLDRIVNVSDITMRIEKSTGDNPNLEVTGTATTFRFVEEPAPNQGAEANPAEKAGGE